MTVPSFTALAPSYARLWANLVPTPAEVPALDEICDKLIAHKATYADVAQTVWGDPGLWFIVALIDQMEGGGGANTYLGNGQSLRKVTTEVPAGRGPFANFKAGCIDALALDGLDKIKAWPIERIAYEFEAWNGWGYLNKPIVDPYLAAQSNEYTEGKYIADHEYSATAVSEQPGALTILKVLVRLDPTIKLTSVTAPVLVSVAAPTPIPRPTETAVTTTATTTAPTLDPATLAAIVQAVVAAQAAAAPPPPPAPQITLASIVSHLQVFAPVVTALLAAFPQTAPFAAVLTAGQNAIAAATTVVATIQTNPAALPTVLATNIPAITPLMTALKATPLATQLPWLTEIETVISNIAAALAPPAVAKAA